MHFEKSFSIKLGIYDGPTFENVNFEINMNKKKESFMLKRIMKTALAASLVFGMSYTAMADVSVGGSFKEYFGQYNSGVKDYTSHFENFGEANLKLKGNSGKVSVYYEIESATNASGVVATFKTQRKVSYASDFGLISIGTIVNVPVAIPVPSANWKTSNVPNSTRKALYDGYTEADGLDIVIPLKGLGMIEVTIHPEAAVVTGKQVRGAAGIKNEGQTLLLGTALNFGDALSIRAGFASETVEEHLDSSTKPEAQTNTYTQFGGTFKMGTMAISAGISTATVNLTSSSKFESSTAAASVDLAELGPGNLNIAIDTETVKDVSDYMGTSVLYTIVLAPGAGLDIGYISGTTGYDDKTKDDVTESFLGTGFYIAF